MHENRETSGVSRSDRDRSEKALSRTADMYAPEESDCAVVPMNRPNKEGKPSAEAGEGRAQAKENTEESNTSPTPSGKRVSQGLAGVRRTAKGRRQEKFTALLHHLRRQDARANGAGRRVAAEGRTGLLPIPRGSGQHQSAGVVPIPAACAVAIHLVSSQSEGT